MALLLRRIVVTLVLALLVAAAGGVFLARVGAGAGWYYVLGVALSALVVLRALAPTVGITTAQLDARRGRQRRVDAHA
jgi:hypothetical protein